MKNMKKLLTLCGFLVLGSIACGDADVVKAEAINEQTTDTSGYTITIPSDVDIDKDSGKGSFAVSGKAEAQVDLNVSVSSKNNYKLKNKSQEISYSLDKKSFHIDNKQSASSKSFNENFTATASDVNTNFSGNYKDNLVFDITGNKTEYYLDLNGWLDGASVPNIDGYGTVDIYIEGKIVASGVSDFYRKYPYGTNYEIKNIKVTTGHVYNGTFSGHLKGRITEPSTTLYPSFSAKTYTLTLNPNDGLINGDGNSKVLDTKLCFDTGNCCDINYLKPTRKGFEFLGWYDAPENGNIVYDSNGKCINNGNYWKESSYINPNDLTVYAQWKKVSYSAGTILNVEGSDYIVMSQTDDDTYLVIDGESLGNIQHQPNVDSYGNYKVGTYETPDEKRPEGQYSNTYAGIYIDNYLENTWYKQLPEKLQKAIQATDIKQSAYNITSSNPKWRWFDPNGGSSNDWYYNEGTTENPKWVVYYKANFPEDAQGAHPLNCWKYSEKGYNNTTYNTISRHVFLPSVEEVPNLVALNNVNKVYDFLKGTNKFFMPYVAQRQ
ncbi:hypothetical protein DXD51_10390 [Eubacterium sp. TM05-53]|nr:hypothetical protein DXD51_10390 [Eubacterium sp. TM05-53]